MNLHRIFTVAATLVLLAGCAVKNTDETGLDITQKWDKIFPLNDMLDHRKVTFKTGFGNTLVGDLYQPMGIKEKLPAIAVCGPFGACKEQASGLYAQTLADMGFVTLAFDPSYTGESSGEPRYTSSPDINTDDFLSAVDYLLSLKEVDPERIGILGICGWGGIALNAAAADTRIKATTAVTMYDMTRVNCNGYFDKDDNEEARFELRKKFSEARTAAVKDGKTTRVGGVPEDLPADAPAYLREYQEYYKTPRGFHVRSANSVSGWHAFGTQAYANARFMRFIDEIRSAVLIIHGENAHSRYFGEDAYNDMVAGNPNPDNKELMIVPGATHCDLYDGGLAGDKIPWEEIADFYRKYMPVQNPS